jgi:hypothetical protein
MTTFRHWHSPKVVILLFSLNSQFVGAEQILQFCFVVQAKENLEDWFDNKFRMIRIMLAGNCSILIKPSVFLFKYKEK